MPRRLALLVALIASLAIIGCSTTPAAPPLTDPKEILAKSVESLQQVKNLAVKGTFGGSVAAGQMGNFDLSSVQLDASVDVEGKKTRLTVDAPTLMGTNVDVIAMTDAVYIKLVGPFAAFAGLDATGKYTKMPIDAESVPEEATDPAKAIEEFQKGLDELPSAPEKLDDEKCGDADCYHVRLAMSAEDLAELSSDAGDSVSSATFDIWSRKSDLRPAKLGFSVDAGAQGTVTGTFEVTYDQGVSIDAPPADQVAPAP